MPALDGVRGIAILLVILYHGSFIVALSGPVGGFFQRLLRYGWAGVDLFFVLSGFLITRILLDCRRSPLDVAHFYARRVLRIFPLYYAFIAALFVAGPLVVAVDAVPGYRFLVGHQIFFWTYL